MTKKEFGPQPWLFPSPTVLVGTLVDGKADFAPYAWCGIAGGEPPAVSVAVRHQRHTLKGIRQNRAFSVNIPSVDLIRETDYCGMVSGAQADKVKDCGFKVYYGGLKTAPLIEQCPVNLECEVLHLLNVGIHMLVIGKIIQSHVSEDCLTDGQPDIMKIRPFVYSRGPAARYNAVGEVLGRAYDIGKGMKQ
ncbi:MAG: NADPH-flavin oxidoreductase [Chloroflexi bacterium RBG_16_56_11]|nr:MAG: NADPH-flavin oxidoreductase [Chloroflexi bacterium RBG_16_56_11]